MTTTSPDQFIAANKASLDAFIEMSQKSFQGVEKLVELNLQAVRATMAESAEAAKALLSVKDAQEFITLQNSLMQPSAEKLSSYSRHIYDIATSTQADVSKVLEGQFAAAQQQVVALVDTAVKNAPAGSEGAVALVKSAMTAANNAMETAQKAAKQAVGVAEANIEAMTQSATKAAAAVAPKAAARRAAA